MQGKAGKEFLSPIFPYLPIEMDMDMDMNMDMDVDIDI